MTSPNRNALWARALIDGLAQSGARFACVSPGSRSTPLALACLAHPGLATTVHLDERSAAFFALGLAKTSGEPAILVCTSGTAAANFFPAIVEARLCQVGLLVLTADRPHEVRGWGAPQAISQVNLYGGHVRWAVDLPLPEPTAPMLAFLGHTAARAVHASRQGPVHLNVPFRDPLPPLEVPGDVPAALAIPPPPRVDAAQVAVSDAALRSAADEIDLAPRGVIALGSLPGDARLLAAVERLAHATGYPVLAEATSGLRCDLLGEALIAHGELLARCAPFAGRHAPQLAIRLGQAPVSRALTRFLDSAEQTLRVDLPDQWIDSSHRAAHLLQGDPAAALDALAQAIAPRSPTDWLGDFQRADACARQAMTAALDAEPALGELHAARALFDALPEDVPLWVASSMPIRDLESAAASKPFLARVLASRGANGIDGTVASALGAAAVSGGRAALLTGDVALLHDLTSLLTAKRLGLSLTVVLVNNDGGGIFSFLEVASAVDAGAFETLWGTPHGASFGPAIEGLGGTHRVIEGRGALAEALRASLADRTPGARVLEVRTVRSENVAAHQRVFAAVDAALGELSWSA